MGFQWQIDRSAFGLRKRGDREAIQGSFQAHPDLEEKDWRYQSNEDGALFLPVQIDQAKLANVYAEDNSAQGVRVLFWALHQARTSHLILGCPGQVIQSKAKLYQMRQALYLVEKLEGRA